MTMTAAALARFRASLIEARGETVRLMSALGEDIRLVVEARQDSNSDDEHDPEGATLAFERAQSDALLRHSRQRLDDIDAALGRIEVGSYGVCERCGAAIAPARLEARPYARLCISCAA